MINNKPIVKIVDELILIDDLVDALSDPDVGAQGWFHGVTRRKTKTVGTDGQSQIRVTSTLSYEAHRPMALRELESIATAAIEKFGLVSFVVVHRLGEVPIGQASVVCGCSSPHREATFDALRWFMVRLKQDVPIWKRETYEDGSTEWVHPAPPSDTNES